MLLKKVLLPTIVFLSTNVLLPTWDELLTRVVELQPTWPTRNELPRTEDDLRTIWLTRDELLSKKDDIRKTWPTMDELPKKEDELGTTSQQMKEDLQPGKVLQADYLKEDVPLSRRWQQQDALQGVH